jgi:hypothetical protein
VVLPRASLLVCLHTEFEKKKLLLPEVSGDGNISRRGLPFFSATLPG